MQFNPHFMRVFSIVHFSANFFERNFFLLQKFAFSVVDKKS